MSRRPRVVALTGAGISAESGIPTFRAADGLWENHRIEDVATPAAFQRDPELVHNFYNQRRRHLFSPKVAPNPAHFALVQLQNVLGGDFFLVTQNVDNLHERAGHQAVCHMHGELLKIRCTASGKVFDRQDDVTVAEPCPCCAASGRLRPHIVWFGEMPFAMNEIQAGLQSCDIFIAIGTSGQVYPAAAFVEWASQARTIEVNLDRTGKSSAFDEHRFGSAGIEVPKLVEEILQL
jgi:NAD-dependent deacetylase